MFGTISKSPGFRHLLNMKAQTPSTLLPGSPWEAVNVVAKPPTESAPCILPSQRNEEGRNMTLNSYDTRKRTLERISDFCDALGNWKTLGKDNQRKYSKQQIGSKQSCAAPAAPASDCSWVIFVTCSKAFWTPPVSTAIKQIQRESDGLKPSNLLHQPCEISFDKQPHFVEQLDLSKCIA